MYAFFIRRAFARDFNGIFSPTQRRHYLLHSWTDSFWMQEKTSMNHNRRKSLLWPTTARRATPTTSRTCGLHCVRFCWVSWVLFLENPSSASLAASPLPSSWSQKSLFLPPFLRTFPWAPSWSRLRRVGQNYTLSRDVIMYAAVNVQNGDFNLLNLMHSFPCTLFSSAEFCPGF